jgi:hypothetical protein
VCNVCSHIFSYLSGIYDGSLRSSVSKGVFSLHNISCQPFFTFRCCRKGVITDRRNIIICQSRRTNRGYSASNGGGIPEFMRGEISCIQ